MLLFQIFEQVPDPRKPGHVCQHQLLDVLSIALCAMLSGAESFVDMADYGQAKETWLRERLGLKLPHGIASVIGKPVLRLLLSRMGKSDPRPE